jgi:hypothetical protein
MSEFLKREGGSNEILAPEEPNVYRTVTNRYPRSSGAQCVRPTAQVKDVSFLWSEGDFGVMVL